MLVVFACQHYASQLALPTSQRRGSVLPRSHDDKARKAFEKATKHVLPGSYGELGRAIAREARAHDKRIAALEQQAPAAPVSEEAGEPPERIADLEDNKLVDEDLEEQPVRAEASTDAIEADVEPVDDVDDDELVDENLEQQAA